MNLQPPEKVRKLRESLHAKAKAAPNYRFYLLYDKLYRVDVLAWAYARSRANDGVSGIDDQDYAAIEAYGRERWLGELAEPGLSGGGSTRPVSAPPVACPEA